MQPCKNENEHGINTLQWPILACLMEREGEGFAGGDSCKKIQQRGTREKNLCVLAKGN
jgi:hypothetical protein